MGTVRVIKAGDGFLIKLVDEWLRVPTKNLEKLAGTAIRSEDDVIRALKKDPHLLDGVRRMSARDTLMGGTPNAFSRTGNEVRDRMARQGRIQKKVGRKWVEVSPEEAATIRSNADGLNYHFVDRNGRRHPMATIDPKTNKPRSNVQMGHKEGRGYLDADNRPIDKNYQSNVEDWKSQGHRRTFEENRRTMLDPDHYEYEEPTDNMSRGGKTGQDHRYFDVEPYPGQGTEADIPGL